MNGMKVGVRVGRAVNVAVIGAKPWSSGGHQCQNEGWRAGG